MHNNIMDNYPQRNDNRYHRQRQHQHHSNRTSKPAMMSSSSSVQPGTINPSSRHEEDNLFHLQQELLRQELPSSRQQQQYNEIRQEQSHRLEMYLMQQEQMNMWQHRQNHHQQNHHQQQQQQHQYQMQTQFHQMNEPPTVQQQDEFTMANNNGMNTRRDARIGGSFSSFGQQNTDYYSSNSNNASSAFHHSPNNNMTSSRRSPSDPPFWGQQQHNQQMHQNYGNDNNSSKDRSRSMGSSPAPFNNMNMRYDMGGQGFNDSTRFGNNNDYYYQETNKNNSFQTSSNDQQRQQYPPNAQQCAPSAYNNSDINSVSDHVARDTRSTPPQPSTMMDFMSSDAPQQQSNESKRRKFNSSSSNLLLQMLNETLLISPESIGKPAVFAGGQYQQHSLRQHQFKSGGASPSTSNNVSPFTNYINRPTLLNNPHKSRFDNEPKISPNPLSIKENANDSSSSIGDTPRLFADYFLCNNDGNGVDVNDMPPLPLVPAPTDSTTTTSNNSKNSMDPQESAAPFKKSFNQASLPLPPSTKKSHGSSSKKKSKGSNSQKKRSSNNDGGDKPTGPNPNHIITPTSATISGIAAEIREQMQRQKKKKKQQASSSTTTSANTPKGKDVSSMGGNNEADSQSSASNNSISNENNEKKNGNNNFSVPQFASTMEASQASQQAIHDWDRKFGLRRAHSKTMRESCRSRKRVLEFLKGAGANLQLLSESLSAATENEMNPSVSWSANSPTTSQEAKEEVNATTTRELDRPVHIKKKIGHDTKYKLGKSVLSNKKANCEQVEQSPSMPSTKNDNESDNSQIMSPNKPPNNAKKTRHLKPSRRHSIVESKMDDQLEQMFRRASLDCVAGLLPCERRQLREADRKQYHARGA